MLSVIVVKPKKDYGFSIKRITRELEYIRWMLGNRMVVC